MALHEPQLQSQLLQCMSVLRILPFSPTLWGGGKECECVCECVCVSCMYANKFYKTPAVVNFYQ